MDDTNKLCATILYTIVVAAFIILTDAPPGQPPEGSQAMVICAGLVALAASLALWPIMRFIITIAHEGSHAITGSMMGATIAKIEIFRSRPGQPRGATSYTKTAGPFGMFLTTMAGYLGPSVFGLGGALLLAAGHTEAVLSISVIFLFIALLNTGNAIGQIATIMVGAAIILIIRNASPGQQTFFAYVWIWFLLIGGFGHVLAFQSERRSGDDTGSDAYRLRLMTFLPASLWSGFFWLATLAALIYGGGILLGLAHLGN
jgi:hypothetical protein